MKQILFLIPLILLPWSSQAQQGEKNFIDQPYIEVTGKADLDITPNEIYLSIRIDEQDNKAKTPLEELEKAMIRSLEEIGLDTEKNLTILDFASNFKSHLLRKTSILTAKQYQLKVHDGQTTARVFLELENLGISNIQIERVSHSQMDSLQNEVKIKAIQAAQEKARMLTRGIGQDAGRALYIQELGNGYHPPIRRAGNVMMKAYAEAATEPDIPEIEFEKIKLEYSILVRFELIDKPNP